MPPKKGKAMSRLSLAMAAYNGALYIEKQLASILAQRRAPDEVIIVDDASGDTTVEIIEGFIAEHHLEKTWHLHKNAQNLGYARAFQRAVELATGEIIFLADQDDIWLENKIERYEEVFLAYPQINLVCAGYDTIDGNDVPTTAAKTYFVDRRFDGRLELLGAHEFVGCSWVRGFSLAFRAALKPYIPWCDPGRLLSHDWLLCLTAAAMPAGALAQPRCAFLHECLAHYRVHGGNVSVRAGRQGLISTERRVKALEDSKRAHEEFLRVFLDGRARSGTAILQQEDQEFVRTMQKQIEFEQDRLRFMQTKNPFYYLALMAQPWKYKCYYKSYVGALRVLAGDFVYTYRREKSL